MARLGLFIPDDMDSAIKQESKKTRIQKSELVRMALEAFLTARGYELETEVEWGGNRKGEASEEA